MNKTTPTPLYVKISDPNMRQATDFTAFATNRTVSATARALFSQAAQELRNEHPDLWLSFLRIQEEQSHEQSAELPALQPCEICGRVDANHLSDLRHVAS